jgi:hypothetical protein
MRVNIKAFPKQAEAWSALLDPEIKTVVYGGAAGGGKSWVGSEWLIYCSYVYPEMKAYIGREELKRLRETTLITFFKVLKHHSIPRSDFKYNGQDHFIINTRTGARIDLLELKYLPSDPMFERYGSSEYTMGWVEEGGEVHEGAFDTLRTRVGRHLNGQFGIPGKTLVTCNPKKNWIYKDFYQPMKAGTLDPRYRFISALPTDNPHLTADYIENLRSIKDKSKRERLLLGNWEYDDNPAALLKYESILDLFRNSHVQEGRTCITADIARYGKDRTVIYGWSGMRMVDAVVLDKCSITEAADAIRAMATRLQVPPSRICVDEDGVGGGVVDAIGATGFVAQKKPVPMPGAGRPQYNNRKSQACFDLADKINAGVLSLMPDFAYREQLIEELEQLEMAEVDNDKKLAIISKDKIKERIGRSPDFMDALMLRSFLNIIGYD